MGLALTRKRQEEVVIRNRSTKEEIARVLVLRSTDAGCRLLFGASDEIEFVRAELLERLEE